MENVLKEVRELKAEFKSRLRKVDEKVDFVVVDATLTRKTVVEHTQKLSDIETLTAGLYCSRPFPEFPPRQK